jgi:hypothetical protein
LINLKIFGVTLVTVVVAASVVFVATGFQNIMATAQLQPLAPMDSDDDVDVAESEEAGNTTMMTNQTAN